MKYNLKANIEKDAMLPDNMMLLSDGTQIPLHLSEEKLRKKAEVNAAEVDRGEVFKQVRREEDLVKFFGRNVFFFIAHYKEILSDSRMFLAPITNIMRGWDATLGIVIEWLMYNPDLMFLDSDGKLDIAVMKDYGMPQVYTYDENGNWDLCFLKDNNVPFSNINRRYYECKSKGEAYTLYEVKEMLNRNDEQPSDYIDKAYRYALTWKAACLDKALSESQRDYRRTLREKLFYANVDRLQPILDGYRKIAKKNDERVEVIRAMMRYLKKRLKAGEISNKDYQNQLTALKKKKASLSNENRHCDAECDVILMLSLIFPDKSYELDALLAWDEERNSTQD